MITLRILVVYIFSLLIPITGSLPVTQSIDVDVGHLNFPLTCPIITKDFHSVLWLLHDSHELIGAATEFNFSKYLYLASTGQLVIKEVQYSDAGIYRCIVKSVVGNYVKQATSAVELIVEKTYKNLWEDEIKGNIVRAGVAVGLVLGTVLSVCLVYSCRYKATTQPTLTQRNRGQYNLSMEPEIPTVEVTSMDTGPEDNPRSNGGKENKEKIFVKLEPRNSTSDRKASANSSDSKLSNLTLQSQSSDTLNSLGVINSFSPIAPRASSESSVVSVGVNTDENVSKAGSTIIYVVAAE